MEEIGKEMKLAIENAYNTDNPVTKKIIQKIFTKFLDFVFILCKQGLLCFIGLLLVNAQLYSCDIEWASGKGLS